MSDSSIGRVVGVLFSPTRTFEAIRQRPTWLVALLVMVVVGMIAGHLVTGKLDVEEVVRDSLANSGRQLSEDQLQQAIDIQEKIMPVMALAGPLIFFPAGCLLMALILWVVLKMMGGELSYKASFATSVHGLLPNAISGLLTLPVVISRSEMDYEAVQAGSILASNLAVFAPEESSAALRSLLAGIDLFSVWSLVLLTIGYAVVARVSRGKAAAAAIGLWVAYVLVKVGLAAAFA